LGQNVKLHYGVEGYHDSIESNNLGFHDRSRGAAYAGVDVRALKRFSFSAGLREELYGKTQSQLSPTAAAGVWLSQYMKLRASVSRAFRLPSYTDLYYHDPANVGSPGLRPEKAWSYEGGIDWNYRSRVRGEFTVFQRREQDGVDYVRASASDIWRATNFQRLHFTGVEASIKTSPAHDQEIELQYTGLQGAQGDLQGFFSKYSFNYPIHSAVASWQALFPGGILARARLGAIERFASDPYAVVDLYVASTRGRLRPFLQLGNLTDTVYQEIFGVPMPGRSVVGGFELLLLSRAK